MKNVFPALVLLLLPLAASAGWNDLVYSSGQSGMDFRQGGNITLVLDINNTGVRDGSAVYISNVTLLPGPCINNGENITVSGGVICPNSTIDIGCGFRFKNATIKSSYSFENLPTSEVCPNGDYYYVFLVFGNKEIGSGGNFASGLMNASPRFTIHFIGPHFCGDGSCDEWKGESCETCGEDCGRCKECIPGERKCVGDDIGECNSDGFWEYTRCIGGCRLNATDEPECVPPCTPGEKQCVSANILAICENHKWRNVSCQFGCLYDDCKGNCETAGCPEMCANSTHLFYGKCNRATGKCTYKSEHCSQGCDEAGIACAGAQQTPPAAGGEGGFDLTLVIVPIILLIVLAVLYLKFIKK